LGLGRECVPDRLGDRFRSIHKSVIKVRVIPSNQAVDGLPGVEGDGILCDEPTGRRRTRADG
jgi:hypothetical protein